MPIKIAIKYCSPEYPREPQPKEVCTLFERCNGCPYPSHGFICWHSMDECMRTDEEKRRNAGKEKT